MISSNQLSLPVVLGGKIVLRASVNQPGLGLATAILQVEQKVICQSFILVFACVICSMNAATGRTELNKAEITRYSLVPFWQSILANSQINSLPASFGDNHFCLVVMEFVPQIFRLQDTLDIAKLFTIAFVPHTRFFVFTFFRHRSCLR